MKSDPSVRGTVSPVDDETRDRIARVSGAAAAAVVPLVAEWLQPRSVVDLGCNAGVWLRAFMEAGVDDVRGYDHPSLDRTRLLIPADRFVPADLGEPIEVDRTFDLAVCLEVAEHIPQSSSDRLLDELAAFAPAILFAAAVPGQGGDGHVNEQWGTWWDERLRARGFQRHDVLRRSLWDRTDVQWWYAQNLALYLAPDHPASDLLERQDDRLPVDLVHPRLFREAAERPLTVPQLARALPGALASSAHHHLLDRVGRMRSRRARS